jgi:hypothetical protein
MTSIAVHKNRASRHCTRLVCLQRTIGDPSPPPPPLSCSSLFFVPCSCSLLPIHFNRRRTSVTSKPDSRLASRSVHTGAIFRNPPAGCIVLARLRHFAIKKSRLATRNPVKFYLQSQSKLPLHAHRPRQGNKDYGVGGGGNSKYSD